MIVEQHLADMPAKIESPYSTPQTASIIEVSNLVKAYPGGVEAVKGISFTVREGEFFGFLGPNGAGKSTTIKILITLLARTSGSARILGYDVAKNRNQVRHLIGYAAQEASPDDELSARQNLHILGNLYHLDGATVRRRTEELLELMDLQEAANRNVGTFSGGMRKRLDLALALIHRPRVLFLDEPTTGLDPQNRAGLWQYLERLNKQEKLTIFLTTHYMEEADKLCDRLAIVDHGQLIAEGSPAALKAELGGDLVTLAFKDGQNGALSIEQQARQAQEILIRLPFVQSATVGQEHNLVVVVANGQESVPQILRALEHEQLYAGGLNLASPSLDDVFLRYTGTRIRQDDPVTYTPPRGPWGRKRR